jgi:ATP-dependent Clp protease ATP-binding subunit ClpC
MSTFGKTQQVKLRDFLTDCFDNEELRQICFELGVDYESLSGEGKSGKALDLILHFLRRHRIADLLHKLYEKRPEQFTDTGLEIPEKERTTMPFPDELIASLPHPLAAICERCNTVDLDTDQFKALDRLLNNVVYYLTAIALSQYWQDNPDRSQLRTWLMGLSHSHLMTTLTILNEISDHYAEAGQASFLYPILFEPYAAPLGDASPVAEAYRVLAEYLPPDEAPAAEPVTPRAFLTRLLHIREVHWESDTSEMDDELRDALLPSLWLALVHLLDHFAALLRYPLRYIEHIGQDGDEWLYTVLDISGTKGEWRQAASQRERADEPTYRQHRLYLCARDGRFLLPLHPILIAYHFKLYFTDCVTANGELQYRNCSTAERWTPPGHRSTYACGALDESGTGEDENLVDQLEQASTTLEKMEQEGRLDEMPLAALLTYLSDEGREALEIALGEALRIGHFWLGVEFLLMGLSKQEGRPTGNLLHELKASRGEFRGLLRGMVGVATEQDWRRMDVKRLGAEAFEQLRLADPETLAADYAAEGEHSPVVTPRMLEVLRDAGRMAGDEKIGHAHLLAAALQPRHVPCLAVNALYSVAVQAGWRPEEVLAWAAQQAQVDPSAFKPPDLGPDPGGVPHGPEPQPPQRGGAQPPALKVRGVLYTYGRDLTALAQAGQLRPAIGEGAHQAMVQVGRILQQTQGNNPILLGDPGVGKTAIVEGFAHRLATDPGVVAQLAGKRIVELSPGALTAGTKYRGELEERVQKLLDEVRQADGEVIVFIDEIHTILGGRAEGGLGTIADQLKPALARGEFPCIGATTVGEYRRHIEADAALARRFAPVWVEEPSVEDAVEIAQTVAQDHLGPAHGVDYTEQAVTEAVHLSVRHIHDEFLPGKAIKLLDQAGPRVTMGGSLSGLKDDQAGSAVTVEIVRAIVAERTGIPLTRLEEDEAAKYLQLEERLKARVKGQDAAIAEAARVVKRARAGLADPKRPLGVFLFAGPTGVGKTELALALAEALFDEEDAILRLDMSEYMEKHQVSRLIGSPPGYVGYAEEGQLTGRLRRRPYSVVLLDEIEKAHKDVQHLFLQLFDAGRLTDARGNLADGSNAIFIMTTNLGAKVPLGFAKSHMPSFEAQMRAAIEEHFTPEFLNRIDRIVFFTPLDQDVLLRIFDREFEAVAARLRAQGVEVEVAEPFKRALCAKYTDPTRGARRLQRGIEDEIVNPLTDKLLASEIRPGERVIIGANEEYEALPQSFQADRQAPPSGGKGQHPERAERDVGDMGLGAEEENRELIAPLFVELREQLEERGIGLELEENVWELLCSPFWHEKRAKLGAQEAFTQLVEEPLLQKIDDGEFQASDRIKVYRNLDLAIDFQKVEGEEQ